MIFLIVLLCIDDCDQILVSVPINYSESYNLQSGNMMIGSALTSMAPKDLDGGIFKWKIAHLFNDSYLWIALV